jgi:hypothetical protein
MVKCSDQVGEDMFAIEDVSSKEFCLFFPPAKDGALDPMYFNEGGEIFYYQMYQKNKGKGIFKTAGPGSYRYEFLKRKRDGSYNGVGSISYQAWNFLYWNLKWKASEIYDFITTASEEDWDKIRIMYSFWGASKK